MNESQSGLSNQRRTVAAAVRAAYSIAAIVLLTLHPRAHGGYVVVIGDYTPAAYLVTRTDPGVLRFFDNLQPSDTTVLLGNPQSGWNAHLYQHYNTSGKSASFSADVTDEALSDVELAVVLSPTRLFTVDEAQAINRLLVSGGNLLAFMDGTQSAGLPFVADLLNKLNVDLVHVPSIVDWGSQAATGSRIASHPLTAGVESFSYGGATPVSGGVPLFSAINGESLAAAVFVPEPASVSLLAAGTIALCAAPRWRRMPERPASPTR